VSGIQEEEVGQHSRLQEVFWKQFESSLLQPNQRSDEQHDDGRPNGSPWASNDREMYDKVKLVLNRLASYNVKINGEKCQFFVEKVKYLGHILSAEGISPNPQKVEAVIKAPAPKNRSQLKSFAGMLMYYAKFQPQLSMKMSPLFNLLKKETEWNWTKECQDIFEQCKKDLCSDKVLMHYDPKLPIVIECDACIDGISGVLSHKVNGEVRPVFYVSRTLTRAEKNNPILHLEALAIVFSLEKFYKYVFGHKVEIFTDHKPLEGIFGRKKGMPPVFAARVQRYILRARGRAKT
jgi:RNase H-like domain found in reverse transcriptase